MQAIQTLGYLDTGFLIILSISVIIGLIRGAVREITSLVGLIIALYLAFKFSGMLNEKYTSKFLSGYEGLSYALTFILVLLVCILAFALINLVISQLLKFSGLSIFDRFLGMIFGVLRGSLIICIFVFVARLFPVVTQSEIWKKSSLVPVFSQVADVSVRYLPKQLTSYFSEDAVNKLKNTVAPSVNLNANPNTTPNNATTPNTNSVPTDVNELNKKIESISNATDNKQVATPQIKLESATETNATTQKATIENVAGQKATIENTSQTPNSQINPATNSVTKPAADEHNTLQPINQTKTN